MCNLHTANRCCEYHSLCYGFVCSTKCILGRFQEHFARCMCSCNAILNCVVHIKCVKHGSMRNTLISILRCSRSFLKHLPLVFSFALSLCLAHTPPETRGRTLCRARAYKTKQFNPKIVALFLPFSDETNGKLLSVMRLFLLLFAYTSATRAYRPNIIMHALQPVCVSVCVYTLVVSGIPQINNLFKTNQSENYAKYITFNQNIECATQIWFKQNQRQNTLRSFSTLPPPVN